MFSKISAYFIFIISASFLIVSCADDPGPVGSDLIKDNDDVILTNYSSDTTQSFSKTSKSSPLLGTSDRLLSGSYRGITSYMMFDFLISLPESLKTDFNNGALTIREATVELFPVYEIGEESSTFDFKAFKILDQWSPATFNLDSLEQITIDSSKDLKTSSLNISDSLYTFPLDLEYALELFKSASQTSASSLLNGLYFSPVSGVNKIVGFRSLNTVTGTSETSRIFAVIEKPGVYVDTLIYRSRNDIHLIKSGELQNVPAEKVVVQGGVAYNSWLKFDVSGIKNSSIINNATISVEIDTNTSILGEPSTDILEVRFITDSVTMAYDSTAIIQIGKSENRFSGNITPFIQAWINGVENNGISLALRGVNSIDQYRLFGSSSAEAQRPRLTVEYSILR